MKGYRQQPGKLPFAKPGSGGKDSFSNLRDLDMIPESEGGKRPQPKGKNNFVTFNYLLSSQLLPFRLSFT